MNRVDLSSQAANSPKKLFITTGSTEVQQKIIFTISLNLIHLLKPLYTILIYLKTCNWTVCNQISLYVDSTFHGTGVCLLWVNHYPESTDKKKKACKPLHILWISPSVSSMFDDHAIWQYWIAGGVTHKLKNIFAQVKSAHNKFITGKSCQLFFNLVYGCTFQTNFQQTCWWFLLLLLLLLFCFCTWGFVTKYAIR